MKRFLEFQYISPTSTYKFTNKYLLVAYNTNNDVVQINKMPLSLLNNVDNLTRAYPIQMCIDINNYSDILVIKLFEISGGSARLFFSGKCDISKIEMNNKEVVKLYSPSLINKAPRYASYNMFDKEDNLLSEQFFNYENTLPSQECLIFVVLTQLEKNRLELSQNIVYQSKQFPYIYDRYCNSIMKEIKYNKQENVIRNIPSGAYTLINAGCDGRVMPIMINNFKSKAFYVNKNKIVFKNISVLNNLPEFKDLKFGAGFVSRTAPQDYQKTFMPYDGYLTDIGMFYRNSWYITVMRFESNYFVPKSVHEREYISVILGHPVFNAKYYPEEMDVQPNTKLIFFVLLLNNNLSFTNKKLAEIKITDDKLTNTNKIWFDKGEELTNKNNYVITLCNRKIQFSSDVTTYNETYIRAKDITGEII